LGSIRAVITTVLLAGCTIAGTATASPSPTVGAAATVTQTASATAAPTPPRTSRAGWALETVSAPDVIARFRSAGLSVEPQPPPPVVLFGAQRLDVFLIQGQTTAIYTFATAAAGARVLDDAANARLTVTYLHTPYYVQVANLLVIITTDDPNAAAVSIRALMGS
jgi:hypothetical protein